MFQDVECFANSIFFCAEGKQCAVWRARVGVVQCGFRGERNQSPIAEPSGQTLYALFFPLFPSRTMRLFSSAFVLWTLFAVFQFCFDRWRERLGKNNKKILWNTSSWSPATLSRELAIIFILWIYNSLRSTTVDFGRVMRLLPHWLRLLLQSRTRKLIV